MKKTPSSNPVRLIAFFLTAIILTCTFGFTVDGWQGDNGQDNTGADSPTDTPPDEGTLPDDPPTEPPTEEDPEIYIPEYTNRITGLEVSAEGVNKQVFAFVMSAALPLFGVSKADLLCEIPTELGSRYVALITDIEELWKIGSITNTRGYISNIAKYFGGILVSAGCEDAIEYPMCDISDSNLDLSENDGYHFTEHTENIYTNPDLLGGAMASTGLADKAPAYSPLPYIHRDFGSESISFAESEASKVTISGGADDLTELTYISESNGYSIIKNGEALTDSLNDNICIFENCFVLYADSAIYDRVSCTQMVMDTVGEGVGYYITCGTYTEIKWTATSGGIMTFYSPSGEKLTINRGSCYISFVRSSQRDKTVFE